MATHSVHLIAMAHVNMLLMYRHLNDTPLSRLLDYLSSKCPDSKMLGALMQSQHCFPIRRKNRVLNA